MLKIELICDEGEIRVFENGRPVGTFYSEMFFPADLEDYLERQCCKYPPRMLEEKEKE